jgi:hydrocephalus-inducing protein
VVADDSWSGAELLEVPAGQSANYTVTYCPMTMTPEGEKHSGSVFFPLADGSAMLFALEGTALAPQAAGTVTKTVTCKAQHTLPLTVKNWLSQPQRFRVDFRAPDKDPATELGGHQYVDVPAGLSRDYALSFSAHKEGATAGQVHFINEKTGEYLFYTLELKAEAAGVLKTLEMNAPLRQLCTQPLPLSNPLDVEAKFTTQCDNAEVTLPPQLVVAPHGSADLRLEWRPLMMREVTSRLTLTSAELGTFMYDLKLSAMPAGDHYNLHFQVALGDAQTSRFRFHNYLRKQETYKLTLADAAGDFEVEASVVAPAAEGSAGSEVAVDVTFEPSKLGDVQNTLTVASADGGEYVCALQGFSLPPKPQGPVAIKAGGSASVQFKNVFSSAVDFTMVCEPPALFTVAKPRENVPAKKSVPISVTYKPAEASGAAATGKLTVTSVATGTSWTYYLQGTAA